MYKQCEQILNRINKKLFNNDEDNYYINTYFDNNENNIFANINYNNEMEELNIINNNENNNDIINNEGININKYNSSDEKKIRINLGLNQCLFEKGRISEAIEKSKHLVKLLNQDLNLNRNSNSSNISDKNLFDGDNNNNNISVEEVEEKINEYEDLSKLSNKLKSKIYGNYAIYMQALDTFDNINKKIINQQKVKDIENFNDFGRRTLIMTSRKIKRIKIKTF